jgi:hypothetical protein
VCLSLIVRAGKQLKYRKEVFTVPLTRYVVMVIHHCAAMKT